MEELFQQLNMVSETQRSAYRAGYQAGYQKKERELLEEEFKLEQDGIAMAEEN